MAQRVRLYEEKKTKKSLPLWGWALAILVAVALIVFFFARQTPHEVSEPTITPAARLTFPAVSPFGPTLAEVSQWPLRSDLNLSRELAAAYPTEFLIAIPAGAIQ